MKAKSKGGVSIIGGADGPTSIFIAGKSEKQPLKLRIRNYIYQCKRKRAEKKIVAGVHTLDELVAYAKNRYDFIEINQDELRYFEQRKSLKESLILQYKPELLGEMENIGQPDISNEESVKEYFDKLNERSKMIAEIPDCAIFMDFHMYEIKSDMYSLTMEIDFIWNIFGISYSGNKKLMRRLRNISQDLYRYYGVSEDDIREKTTRYSSLVMALSS